MRHTKTVVETNKVEKDSIIECNKCGKRCDLENMEFSFDIDMLHEFLVSFGYGSSYDMESWGFDLCEDCLLELIKTFKIVPEGFRLDEYSPLDSGGFEHQLTFEDWKNTSEWNEFKYCSYEKIVEYDGLLDTDYLNELIKEYHPKKPLLSE